MTALDPLFRPPSRNIQRAADALLACAQACCARRLRCCRVRSLASPAAALSAQELARVRSVNERLGVVLSSSRRCWRCRSAAGQCGAARACTTYGAGHRPTARIYRAAG